MKGRKSDMAYTAGIIYDHIVGEAKEPHVMNKDEFVQQWIRQQRHRSEQAARDRLAEEEIDDDSFLEEI